MALEASTNAFDLHDVLLQHVKRVAVAHPLYLRWIAESRMKMEVHTLPVKQLRRPPSPRRTAGDDGP